MASIIRCQGLSKKFGDVVAVDAIDLAIEEGEFFALLGPSGCGKTTLLRMMAGLERPSDGKVLIDNTDVTDIPPNKRPVNMVFQSYALFPHMNVADNVGYGLKVSGVAQAERDARVADVLNLVHLGGYEKRKPDELSGGQRQRVALARALIKRPRVLLLDEPLSALDAKLREQMRFELVQIQKEVGITFVFVTHDQDEALSLASRIAVMHQGKLVQVGAPAELYERPNSRLVADFIGQVNLFAGNVERVDGRNVTLRVPELGTDVGVVSETPLAPAQPVWLALRPEKIALEALGAAAPRNGALTGTIRQTSYLGSGSLCQVELPTGALVKAARLNIGLHDSATLVPGQTVSLSWPPQAPAILLI